MIWHFFIPLIVFIKAFTIFIFFLHLTFICFYFYLISYTFKNILIVLFLLYILTLENC